MAKKFISFLGTNLYKECKYSYPDGSGNFSSSVRFIQEATLEYLCEKEEWTEEDSVLIVVTEDSVTNNWKDNHSFVFDFIDDKGCTHHRADKQKEGLQTRLNNFKDENGYEFNIDTIPLLKEEEKDMWKIFDKIFAKINRCDSLYVDVTHGFRYLPMFLMVFNDFAKFDKGIEIKHISYGNWEACDSSNIAPIVDLMDIVELKNLTQVAEDFKAYGKIKDITNIFDIKSSDKPIKTFVFNLKNETSKLEEYILTNKVEEIKKGAFVQNINSSLKNIRKKGTLTTPQDMLLTELENAISGFQIDGQDKNVLAAVDWSLKYDMIQQAYTLAKEYLISLATAKYKSLCFYENDNLKWRNFMSSILSVDAEVIKTQAFDRELADNVELTTTLFEDETVVKARRYFSIISANRNVLCHAKPTQLTIKQFKEQLTNNFKNCIDLLSVANNDSNPLCS